MLQYTATTISFTFLLLSAADDSGDAMISWEEAFILASNVKTDNMNLTQVDSHF